MAGFTACSDDQTVIAALNPASYSASTQNTGWFAMGPNRRCQAIIALGTLGASEVVTYTVKQATTNTGTSAKVLSGTIGSKTGTLTTASTQTVVNFTTQDFDVNNGFNYAEITLSFAVGGSEASIVVLGDPQAKPPTLLSGVTVPYSA